MPSTLPPGYEIEAAPQQQAPGGIVMGRARPPAPPAPPTQIALNEDRRAEERLRLQRDADARAAAAAEHGKPTADERTAAAYAYRAFGANRRLNELAQQRIYRPSTPMESLFQVDRNGILRLNARTEQDRMFIAAAREWLSPVLRKDTGAAVSDEELRTYMQMYIPAYEDSPRVMWQKAQARDTAMRALYGTGQRAYDEQYGAPGRWQVLAPETGKPRVDARRLAPADQETNRNRARMSRARDEAAGNIRRPAPPRAPAPRVNSGQGWRVIEEN